VAFFFEATNGQASQTNERGPGETANFVTISARAQNHRDGGLTACVIDGTPCC
jgi:hypothetical protein